MLRHARVSSLPGAATLAVLALLAGCQGLGATAVGAWPDPLVGSRWLALSLSAPSAGSMEALKERAPNLQFISLQQVGGWAGCNRFSGPAVTTAEGARFGPLAMTRQACPGESMQREDRFVQALHATRSLRLEGDQLSLLGDDGRVLLTLLRTP